MSGIAARKALQPVDQILSGQRVCVLRVEMYVNIYLCVYK